MEPTQLIANPARISPWLDPTVDQRGHDPRGAYAEQFWLPIVGPTAMWILRRLADQFDQYPDGYTLDFRHTAAAMGVSFKKGANSPFGKSLYRCVMFGLAQPVAGGFAVRRRLPSVARRHIARLPDDVQARHERWAQPDAINRRDLERHLVDAGVPLRVATRASEAAALAS